MILGIDEVGRGVWAGPLVVGAVVLPDGMAITGLTDSKLVSAKKRRELEPLIKRRAVAWGLGWVHPNELDEIGLAAALRVATGRAVSHINKDLYTQVIIDGISNFLPGHVRPVSMLKKADLLIPSVSAASILAKVARDEYMAAQDEIYSGYGFMNHVGYGTAQHAKALAELGPSPIHRRSVAPVAARAALHTKAIGDSAERRAVEYLKGQHYRVVECNWKTRWCEVDIIAEKEGVLYFVEVRYRKDTQYGGAVGSLTSKKLAQMRRAAKFFLAGYMADTPARLAVVVIDGTRGSFMVLE